MAQRRRVVAAAEVARASKRRNCPPGLRRDGSRGSDDHAMRMIKGDFVVTGPDIDPMRFKSRREARNWCAKHHPGSPIEEVGRGGKRAEKQRPKTGRGEL